MTTLTQAQRDMLQSAADREGGFVDAPSDKVAKATANRLIKAGLLMSIPVEGEASRLLITDKGRSDLTGDPPAGTGPTSENTPLASAPGTTTAQALAEPPKVPAEPKGKIGIVVGLLRRPGGASIAEMMAATGWQAHSVRGAIAGAIKKGLGLSVSSEKLGDERRYAIEQVGAE